MTPTQTCNIEPKHGSILTLVNASTNTEPILQVGNSVLDYTSVAKLRNFLSNWLNVQRVKTKNESVSG